MTNIFYPARRTIFFALLLAGISAATVAAVAVRHALDSSEQRFAVFSIRSGERVSDLWRSLERRGIGSQAALLHIAETVPFASFPFAPPPTSKPNRFEGLFVPGNYRIALPRAQNADRSQRLFEDNLRIITVLLKDSAARLAKFDTAGGLPTYADMILASIVQKEDVPGRNYGLVASVFLNRLKAGMRLSSCPTLEYALGYHRPFLLASDIAVRSPYNTYLHHGLPPTPICFFTDAALAAVVHPVTSPYYFFVLDWVKDRIYFAKNYAQQERNARVAKAEYVRVHGPRSLHRKEVGVFYSQGGP